MPPQLMSPRLPGVHILPPEPTGPQYRRWRRGLKDAFLAKGTWGYCDGTCPMPMPTQGPTFFAPISTPDPQPELLDQRKAWSKKDRDVKLDIFLSVANDIKLDVFEVEVDLGSPNPPKSMTARQMMEALDERFEEFKFEEYHHVFCHFLNLHIDQYASLDEFNVEFVATLEDLLDHGRPLDNVQACSAYFSKMRCTQNPWVVKKLKEWDTMATTPLLADLMKDCPPWHVIKPLALKTPSQPTSESYSEDLAGSQGEEENSEDTASISSDSSREQEITVHASYEDLTEAFALPTTAVELPATPLPIPERTSSKEASISAMSPLSLPTPINKNLPPLPPSATTSTFSVSPKPPSATHLRVPVPSPRSKTPRPTPRLTTQSPNLLTPSTASASHRRPTTSPSATTSSSSASASIPHAQPSIETFASWPPRSPLIRQDSNDSSILDLPLQGISHSDLGLGLYRAELATTPPNTSPVKEREIEPDTHVEFDRFRDMERAKMGQGQGQGQGHNRKRSWSIKSRWSGRS